jgi:hypothetical protein
MEVLLSQCESYRVARTVLRKKYTFYHGIIKYSVLSRVHAKLLVWTQTAASELQIAA